MPRLAVLAHYKVSIVTLLAQATLIAFSGVCSRTLGAKSFRIVEPLAISQISDHGQLILAKVALDALVTGELAGSIQQIRGLGWRQAMVMDRLVAH